MHTAQHYINMEGVIPNSKVVILPPSRPGDAWKRELFLRPGEWIPWVTLTVVAGTAVLAVIVLVLHLNEKVGGRFFFFFFLFLFFLFFLFCRCSVCLKESADRPFFFVQREDELERRRASHHINFDAL
jgi:integrin alpha FG-GAP repeat containing protein 1